MAKQRSGALDLRGGGAERAAQAGQLLALIRRERAKGILPVARHGTPRGTRITAPLYQIPQQTTSCVCKNLSVQQVVFESDLGHPPRWAGLHPPQGFLQAPARPLWRRAGSGVSPRGSLSSSAQSRSFLFLRSSIAQDRQLQSEQVRVQPGVSLKPSTAAARLHRRSTSATPLLPVGSRTIHSTILPSTSPAAARTPPHSYPTA